ncbi:hypothetical protein JCM11491_006598 [Sporobolomyces phaffii]
MSALFFGAFVHSVSLCFAADAYHVQHRTLLAVDLIRSRRRNGRLAFVSPTRSIARVPDEVWLLVQQQLVDQATLEEEVKAVDSYDTDCPCCYHESTTPNRWTRGRLVELVEFKQRFASCDGMRGILDLCSSKIDSLLHAFGLSFAIEYHIVSSTNREYWDDLDALSAISVTVCSTDDCNLFWLAHSKIDDRVRRSSIVRVSCSTIAPPLAFNLRLKRFLSLFNLRIEAPPLPTLYTSAVPLDSPLETLSTAHTIQSSSGKQDAGSEIDATGETNEQIHDVICCPSALSEPHWFLA